MYIDIRLSILVFLLLTSVVYIVKQFVAQPITVTTTNNGFNVYTITVKFANLFCILLVQL